MQKKLLKPKESRHYTLKAVITVTTSAGEEEHSSLTLLKTDSLKHATTLSTRLLATIEWLRALNS
jgi:hypothetical protein